MEAVSAEQQRVALHQRRGERPGVDLYLGPDADAAGHDVASRVGAGLFRRELALADQLGDQRMVTGQLLDRAVADQIGAAVADVRQESLGVADDQRRAGGAHADALGVAVTVLVHDAVGGTQRADQIVQRRPVALTIRAQQRLDREPARDLAGTRAAHAVGDHQQRAALAELGRALGQPAADHVLVPGALETRIAGARHLQLHAVSGEVRHDPLRNAGTGSSKRHALSGPRAPPGA